MEGKSPAGMIKLSYMNYYGKLVFWAFSKLKMFRLFLKAGMLVLPGR
jgi:hypothetical protein